MLRGRSRMLVQGVKAVAVARDHLRAEGVDLVVKPLFVEVSRTARYLASHDIPHGTVSRMARYPAATRYLARHGIPHGSVSHAARYPTAARYPVRLAARPAKAVFGHSQPGAAAASDRSITALLEYSPEYSHEYSRG